MAYSDILIEIHEGLKKETSYYERYCDWDYDTYNKIYYRSCGFYSMAHPDNCCPNCGKSIRMGFDENRIKNATEKEIFIKEDLRNFNFNKIKNLVDNSDNKEYYFVINLESSDVLNVNELQILMAKLKENGYSNCPIAHSGHWGWGTSGCYIRKEI